MNSMMLLVIIIGIFYFLVIRPQRKQQLEQQRFLERLKEGDRVITASGIFGRIVQLGPEVAVIDVGDRTRVKFLRSQISRYQPDYGDQSEKSDDDDDDRDKSGGGSSRSSRRRRGR
jgi:preprotein translocase subunit YajC